MTQTATLADHLDRHTDGLIALWRDSVERRGNVPVAEDLSDFDFADHIPEVLDRLADRLRGRDVPVESEGRKHGLHRWVRGYDIAAVVRELSHLRATLSKVTWTFCLRNDFQAEAIESALQVIDDVIDEATAESVKQFEEETRRESSTTRAMLESREADARSEQIKLRTVLDSLPVGVWVVNAEGTVVAMNREAQRLQGVTAKETVGLHNVRQPSDMRDFRTPDGVAYTTDRRPSVRALNGELIEQEEILWNTPQGTRFVTVNAAPLTLSDGKTVGAVVVVQNVTERKRLERQLAASENQFRNLVENSPVMIWRADTTGACDYFNPTWVEFVGRSNEDLIARGWLDDVHPDDRDACLSTFMQALAQTRPFEMVYRLRRRDGVYRWISDHGGPYFDAQGALLGYLGSCMDITSRIELEEELEKTSRHKSRVMSALSHDARTPLNAVVLATRLLEDQIPDAHNDREVSESLRMIRDSVRNILDLFGDLLDLSRLDSGVAESEESRFPLVPTLAECLSSIELQAREKGLAIRFDPDQLAGSWLQTDRSKFKQILANLLTNALRYTEAGSITLSARLDADAIRVDVEDTGPGIAPEDQERIFDEFTVLNNPDRPRTEGTGLGLAICRRLAVVLGGSIELHSIPGRGSRFTLRLAASRVTRQADAPPPTAPAQGPAGGGTIVVAEDHPDSRRMLARLLRRVGYNAIEVENGRQLMEALETTEPILVLMDVNMPEMDGIAATRAIRSNPRLKELPILALTGDVSVVNQRRIGEAGVDGYLAKPVTWEDLERALARIREHRRA